MKNINEIFSKKTDNPKDEDAAGAGYYILLFCAVLLGLYFCTLI